MPDTTVYTGKVTADSLRIRKLANSSSTVLGALLKDDQVTGTIDDAGWWSLQSWTRNGVAQVLPANPCYASGLYIAKVTLPPTTVQIQVTHSMDIDGVTYIPTGGNPITFVRQ